MELKPATCTAINSDSLDGFRCWGSAKLYVPEGLTIREARFEPGTAASADYSVPPFEP